MRANGQLEIWTPWQLDPLEPVNHGVEIVVQLHCREQVDATTQMTVEHIVGKTKLSIGTLLKQDTKTGEVLKEHALWKSSGGWVGARKTGSVLLEATFVQTDRPPEARFHIGVDDAGAILYGMVAAIKEDAFRPRSSEAGRAQLQRPGRNGREKFVSRVKKKAATPDTERRAPSSVYRAIWPARIRSGAATNSPLAGDGTRDDPRASKKDTKLAQELGQPQSFIVVFPQECVSQLASFGPI